MEEVIERGSQYQFCTEWFLLVEEYVNIILSQLKIWMRESLSVQFRFTSALLNLPILTYPIIYTNLSKPNLY